MNYLRRQCILGVIFACWNVVALAQSDPIVSTPVGDVLGSYMTSSKGRQFYAFQSIPFAQPPVGDLRFAAPVKADPWTGVLNGTERSPACFQLGVGQEDCLTLNVYTPKLPPDATQLPVLVFIYGGAFILGSDTSLGYGPHRYLDYDIVLVLMNYRVGPFGFLSTYDAAAPGNFGMMDQVMALEWVRDNIKSFGGNPDDVTLSGESAGSDSTTLHVLSPKSAGLFHRAIGESGTPLTPWGIIENPKIYAQQLADAFNCSTNDSYEIVACLREQDALELYNKALARTVDNLVLTDVPVIENPNENPLFLWEDPLTLLNEGRFNKVPLLAGFNRDEGCLIYAIAEPLGLFREINDFFFDVNLPLLLRILTDYRDNLVNVSYAIKDLYYSVIDLNDTDVVTRTNIDLLSHMFMTTWVLEYDNLVAKNGLPVYVYEFDYVGQHSFTNLTGEPDVTHGDELQYLFNLTVGIDRFDLNENDTAVSDMLLSLWTNFTIHGHPTPAGSPFIWPELSFNSTQHISINKELSVVDEYAPDKMNFWIYEVPKIVNGS